MKTLVLMRGPSGCGKSTYAEKLKAEKGGVIFSTDDFFMIEGKYQFNISKLGEYHNKNRERTLCAMKDGVETIIIDNTNINVRDMEPYFRMASQYEYEIQLIQMGVDFPAVSLAELVERQKQRAGIGKELDRSIVERMFTAYAPVELENIVFY